MTVDRLADRARRDRRARRSARAAGADPRAGTAARPGRADAARCVVIASPRALRRLLWQPGRARPRPGLRDRRSRRRRRPRRRLPPGLGSSRANVIRRLQRRRRPTGCGAVGARAAPRVRSGSRRRRRRRRPGSQGRLHSRARDRAVIAHHYDLSNDFYELILDEHMAYSCAYYADAPSAEPAAVRRAARQARADLPQARPRSPGMRLLDVGCGWGSLSLHAARAPRRARHRRHAVAAAARVRAEARRRPRPARPGRGPAAGLPRHRRRPVRRRRVDRDGRARRRGELPALRRRPAPSAAPGRSAAGAADVARRGRRPAAVRSSRRTSRPTCTCARSARPSRCWRPVASRCSTSRTCASTTSATAWAWHDNFEPATATTIVDLVGEEVARVWRLYLVGGALAFEEGRMGVDQILAVATPAPCRTASVSDFADRRRSSTASAVTAVAVRRADPRHVADRSARSGAST